MPEIPTCAASLEREGKLNDKPLASLADVAIQHVELGLDTDKADRLWVRSLAFLTTARMTQPFRRGAISVRSSNPVNGQVAIDQTCVDLRRLQRAHGMG